MGLRSGEVVPLDRGDVDLTKGVVLVCKTKFRKDRSVRVHRTTQGSPRYARERDTMVSWPKGEAFFLRLRGGRLSATGLQSNVSKAHKLAGLDKGKPRRNGRVARTGARVSEATGVNVRRFCFTAREPEIASCPS
ncbi:tyrosine-type recombinase/integrase [Bradyrhizobium sp. Arg816]|uniref:tyrosine-type recombinase/integrase n=1 Tax=Bradyrhizobium sp. Arg816 TaxID=2998491 RepID=UPI00249DAEF3|nr:tyrosine-type recombinase/integrase [Bradyrhizobium sp. Arg816]MDI3567628.1 tyrosine-type recombinase/integrase [Bradyrhizobium sp. Arg816]